MGYISTSHTIKLSAPYSTESHIIRTISSWTHFIADTWIYATIQEYDIPLQLSIKECPAIQLQGNRTVTPHRAMAATYPTRNALANGTRMSGSQAAKQTTIQITWTKNPAERQ